MKILAKLALLALPPLLSACVTPETVRYTSTDLGVAFYGEAMHNTATEYYAENLTSEVRCATFSSQPTDYPSWFRLAPGEKKFLGYNVLINYVRSASDLSVC